MNRTKRQPLSLEPLEQRALLSTCHVTRLADAGGGFGMRGDLRYCINKVNEIPERDVIDFKVMGTIGLASALPHLQSDIDFMGPGIELLTITAQRLARGFYSPHM